MKELSQPFPVTACCEFFGLPTSSYYRRAAPPKPADDSLRRAIKAIAGQYPTYGSRRIAAQLALAPCQLRVGRKRVRRLMAEMNLLVKPKRARSTTNSRHGYRRYPNLVKGKTATRPDEIWAADITYIPAGSRDAYLAIVMDVFTRAIRGWQLSRSQEQQLTLSALNMALDKHGAPAIHHSDQGGQYAAKKYVKLLQDAGTQISMAAAGKPSENGFVERLMRTIKEEEVYLSEYRTLAEAREQLGHFIDEVYGRQRIHSALGYQPPARFETQWRKNPP